MNLVEILSVIAAAFGASLLVLHGEGIVQIPLAVRVTIGLFLATIPVAPTAAAYLSEKRAVGKEVASHYEWIRKFMVYAHLPAKAVLGRREKAVAAEALVDGSGRLTVRVAVI